MFIDDIAIGDTAAKPCPFVAPQEFRFRAGAFGPTHAG